MARIFISYRRQGESGYVVLPIKERIIERFGEDSVFLDVDDIPFGVDFREHLSNAVGQCEVLIAVIGSEWMGPVQADGRAKIHQPSDYVRIEVETALKRKIPVIPVLVGSAQMPLAGDLPESMADLIFRNATEVRSGQHIEQHLEALVEGIEELIRPKTQTPTKQAEAPKRQTPRPPPLPPARPPPTSRPPVATPAPIAPPAPLPAPPLVKPTPRAPVIGLPPRPAPVPAPPVPPPIQLDDRSLALLGTIRQILGNFVDPRLFLAPVIPPQKLLTALSAYAPGARPEQVLLLYDTTVFGGAREGIMLTADRVFWHNLAETPNSAHYPDIGSVALGKGFMSASIQIGQRNFYIRSEPAAIALANVLRGVASARL